MDVTSKRNASVGILVLSLIVAQVRAADDRLEYSYMAWGAGQISCGAATDIFESGNREAIESLIQWVNGFITGMNVAHAVATNRADVDWANGKDEAARTRWIRTYCSEMPLSTLGQAALKLLGEIADET